MAAVRRWSVITAGAALAGALASRLDGRPLVTVTGAIAVTLVSGLVAVVRSRRVSADEAARFLDARFGLDEQVATALYVSGTGNDNPLVSSLIERAAELVADKRDVPGPRLAPAYGEWAVMAVTAATVAAVAAAPGSHRAAGWVSAASGASATAVGGATRPGPGATTEPGATAQPGGTTRSGAPPSRTAASLPGTEAASSLAGGTGSSGGSSDRARPQPSVTSGPQASPAAGGSQAAGSAQATAAPAAGSAKPGTATPRAGAGPGTAQPASGRTSPSPGTAGTPGAARTGGLRHAAGTRGGVPGGDTAGTRPGNKPTPSAPAQPLPDTGSKVLLIVLPDGDGNGALTVRASPPSAARQPEGSGGIATVTGSPVNGGSTVYVAPDANEVPLGDQALVGRYF